MLSLFTQYVDAVPASPTRWVGYRQTHNHTTSKLPVCPSRMWLRRKWTQINQIEQQWCSASSMHVKQSKTEIRWFFFISYYTRRISKTELGFVSPSFTTIIIVCIAFSSEFESLSKQTVVEKSCERTKNVSLFFIYIPTAIAYKLKVLLLQHLIQLGWQRHHRNSSNNSCCEYRVLLAAA